MKNGLRLEVKGTIFYPWLTKVNPKSGKYQFTLGNLDEATAQRLRDYGATVKRNEAMGNHLSVKNTRDIFDVVDAQGNKIPNKVLSGMGGGTVANVKLAIIPTPKGNPAQCFNAVQVLDFVEYTGGNSFAKQEGYTVASGGNIVEEDDNDGEWDDDIND